jgi:hypothetical protein
MIFFFLRKLQKSERRLMVWFCYSFDFIDNNLLLQIVYLVTDIGICGLHVFKNCLKACLSAGSI